MYKLASIGSTVVVMLIGLAAGLLGWRLGKTRAPLQNLWSRVDKSRVAIQRWFKGSTETYYFVPGNCGWSIPADSPVQKSTLFDADKLIRLHCVKGAAIEINRGPLRRKSQVHASIINRVAWLIARDWKVGNTDWVRLEDTRGVPVEVALRMINQYTSLQAILDRINELEQQLMASERQRHDKLAGIKAILRLIEADRNRYRSKTSERIRKWLEDLDRSVDSGESQPSSNRIRDWETKFSLTTHTYGSDN